MGLQTPKERAVLALVQSPVRQDHAGRGGDLRNSKEDSMAEAGRGQGRIARMRMEGCLGGTVG